MSHITGTLQVLPSPITIGPGVTPFNPPAAPGGTKLLMLHFTNLNFKPGDQLQVDLGYGTDTFTAADGPAFWTRPINIYPTGGAVTITYIKGGAADGSVQLDMFGRGERHDAVPAAFHAGNSNCDPFYVSAAYVEPDYDAFWFCAQPPHWDNAAVVTNAADVRAKVMPSVGMIYTQDTQAGVAGLSTCSVTLIDSDKILTAGHCHTPQEALTSSVTFDYTTDKDGNRPGGYNPKFYKVKEVLFHHNDAIGDFSILRLAEPVVGVPIVQMRHDLPGIGEQVFGIHHPNGAVKKLSPPMAEGFSTVKASTATGVTVPKGFHVSGGSSGSGLFDMAGRILGVLSNGNPCCNGGICSDLIWFPTKTILAAIVPAPPPPTTRDVMVVFDRSGSMSEDDGTGRPKIEAARDSASLFYQLIKANGGNRAGLVSFDTTPHVDQGRADVTAALKTTLVGLPPFITGKVGGLTPGSRTSIGGGLDSAKNQLNPPGANPRAILLMTDGMQNEGLAPADVDLSGLTIHAIGFGSESNLDGNMLTNLATSHGGRYLHAGGGLTLEKFFSDAFGNIFENGIIHDPEVDLPADQSGAKTPFRICGEDAMTVVAGWNRTDASLLLEVTSPGGAVITSATPAVESSAGRTWAFLRFTLPIGGERDGLWQVRVVRPSGEGEFPPPAPAMRYFINVIATGGPLMSRMPDSRRYYTGDKINPRVIVRYSDGGWPEDMNVSLTITRPDAGVGNILSAAGLNPPGLVDGDIIPARQATLQSIEAATGNPVVHYVDSTITLVDEPGLNGSFESGGIFARPLLDLFKVEGNYTFHAKAEYTKGCTGQREIFWSIHIDVGIDPGKTTVSTTPLGDGPDGGSCVRMTFTPRDRYGNLLGPGRLDGFKVVAQPGSTPSGPVHDLGNGSYQVDVCSDPDSLEPPSIGIDQPGRGTVVVRTPEFRLFVYSVKFACGEQKDDCCRCTPVVPGRYSTEINILNPHNKLAAVGKRVIPLVRAGAAAGREPKVAKPISTENIRLPGHSATMDDCCRILELALGAPPAGPVPITIGILEIISNTELAVTAVYTASPGNGGAPSMDVEQIIPRLLVT